MKKGILLLILIVTGFMNFGWGLESFNDDPSVYTRDKNQVVNDQGITDPIRDGTKNIANQIKGIANDEINDSNQAQSSVLALITGVINYFLGLLALVALVFLLYHGFLMVTAAGDDAKYKKGIQGLRIAATALVLIGVSWFIVSLIISVIKRIAF